MTEKTIYVSNGINESHYVVTVNEDDGVMVHSGGALRFHAPPAKLVELLNALEGLAASTVAPSPKEKQELIEVKTNDKFTRMRVIDFFIELCAFVEYGLPALDELLAEPGPRDRFKHYKEDLEHLLVRVTEKLAAK